MSTSRSAWDHARTALIVLHVIAITLMAIPNPGGVLTEKNKTSMAVHQTLEPWTKLVQKLGLARNKKDAVDWLWASGKRFNGAHAMVTFAADPYVRSTGQFQQWRMFGSSPNQGGALEIHGVTAGGEYEPLFVSGGPQWKGAVLNHHRFRKTRSKWSQRRNQRLYDQFAAWLATQDHGYPALRVRMQGMRIPSPKRLRNDGVIRTQVYWEVELKADQ